MSLGSWIDTFRHYTGSLSRRDLFRGGGLLALPALVRGSAGAASAADLTGL